MTRILAFLIAITLWPLTTSAQEIDVLSGEHVDFSRLVMQFPTVVDWEFGRDADGRYILRVDQPDVTFNTDQVYVRMPKTRIRSLNSQDSSLVLNVQGTVHGDAFELRAGRIVIDIKDGAPAEDSPFETVLAATAAAPVQTDSPATAMTGATAATPEPTEAESMVDLAGEADATPGLDDMADGEDMVAEPPMPPAPADEEMLVAGAGDERLGIVVGDRLTPADRVEFPIILPNGTPHAGTATRPSGVGNPILDEKLAEHSDRVNELEQKLIEQIGRAVSQGLLNPDLAQTEKTVEDTQGYRSQSDTESAPRTQHVSAQPEEVVPEEERTHIRIESSIDREQKNRSIAESVDIHGTTCLENNMVDVASWGSPLDDGLDLARLRAGAIGEFDLPDPDGVKNLARYYIYLTFGAEAKSVLTDFGVTVPGHDILWAMSDIMDKGYTDRPGRLEQQFRCDGVSAFWSVMSKDKLNSWEDYNMNSLMATFSALPLHLRRHLGPKLSERFLAMGDEDTAKNIQNAIARAGGEHGDAFDLLDAEFKLADGNMNAGVAQLESIVEENGPNAAEALVRLIATRASEGRPIDRRVAENAEAMAVEFRGDPYEETLHKAAIIARIHSGDVDMATRQILSLMSDANKDDPKIIDLLSQSLDMLASSADNPTFSKIVLGHIDQISRATFSDVARLKTAERLVDMGFFDPALSLMSGYTKQDDEAAKMVLARAFYGENEMEAAIRYASQVQSDDAKRLVSKAYFYLEEPAKAVEALDGLSDADQSDALSLVAEDWDRLEQSAKPGLAGLADVVTGESTVEDANEDGVPSLSSVKDLLSSSREARDALEAVLN